MFRRNNAGAKLVINLDGAAIVCFPSDTVTGAIAANGRDARRLTTKRGQPRAPFCLMGTCFECLVEIDGKPDSRGCLTRVEEGMEIRSQRFVIGSDWV